MIVIICSGCKHCVRDNLIPCAIVIILLKFTMIQVQMIRLCGFSMVVWGPTCAIVDEKEFLSSLASLSKATSGIVFVCMLFVDQG